MSTLLPEERTRLKALLIDRWRAGGGDTLVKAVPRGLSLDPDRMAGYCTTVKYLRGCTPAEMEARLGLRADSKLALGADIYRVDPLPSAAQFEFRSYSTLPGGIATDDPAYRAHPDYPPGLGVPQWELVDYPQDLLVPLASLGPGERFACPDSLLPGGIPQFL